MERIVKSYKYRIYPSNKQITLIKDQFRLCNNLYNSCLEQRISNYKHIHPKYTSKYDQLNELKELKQFFPEYKTIHSQVLQNVIDRVDKSFSNFFNRVKKNKSNRTSNKSNKVGFPRYKPYKEYKSFTLPQSGYKLISKLNNKNKLKISKLGELKIVLHRPVEGIIKSCTVKKTKTDKWFVIFTCECIPKRLEPKDESIGIDLNVKNTATLSNGQKIENPKWLKLEEKELNKANQKLSKTQKKSKARNKRKLIVAKIHERISNKRENFHQQNSRKIVDQFQLICFEKLQIQKMMNQDDGFGKNIADVGWGTFIKYTESKAGEAGRSIEKVNPKNTSKMCSNCFNLMDMPLDVRLYQCSRCKLVIDRDHNAALNILRLGIQSYNLKLDNVNLVLN